MGGVPTKWVEAHESPPHAQAALAASLSILPPQAPGASSDPSPEGGHEIPVDMPTFRYLSVDQAKFSARPLIN